jgi:hypothetical protein
MHRFSVSLNRRFFKWGLVVVFTFLALLTIHQAFLLPAPTYIKTARSDSDLFMFFPFSIPSPIDNSDINESSNISSFEQHRKFAFMKNHKCGSSTIENIIFR